MRRKSLKLALRPPSVAEEILWAIVGRELRVAARRRSTYWTRALAVLLGTLLLVWMLEISTAFAAPAQAGRALFGVLAFCAWLSCVFAGVFLTADCLSEEKREGTLGLLFLTDLRARDIIVGKLVANSVNGLYGTVALLPVLGIAMFLGGVSLWELFRVAVGLLVTLLFSLTLGMACSAVSRQQKASMVATGALVVAFGILPALIPGVRVVTPLVLHESSFDSQYLLSPINYYLGLIFVLGFAALFFGRAAKKLPHSWQDEPARLPMAGAEFKRAERQAAKASALAARRGAELDLNPSAWLLSRRRRPDVIWAAIGFFTLILGLMWMGGPGSWIPAIMAIVMMHVSLKLCMAWEASRLLDEHRRSGGLELVLVTDVGIAEFLGGCVTTLRRLFKPATVFVVCLDVAAVAMSIGWAAISGGLGNGVGFFFGTVFAALVLVGMLLLDLWALAWLGLLLGLRARASWQAAFNCAGRLLLLPSAIPLSALALSGGVAGGFFGAPIVGFAWLIVAFSVSAVFGGDAKRRLHEALREEAFAWRSAQENEEAEDEEPVAEEFYSLVR